MVRILVIDDDTSVCRAIESLLRHHACVPVIANSTRLGIEAFNASNFSLVMVDIFMPEMDGIETIKYFRNRTPALPIVAMSGFRFRSAMAPTPDSLEIAARFGATYFLRKPFGPQELMTAVNVCLDEATNGAAPLKFNTRMFSRCTS